VEEYLVDLNASAAARRAGYRGDANTVGPRLLANVGVQAAIVSRQADLREKTEITQERVVDELAKIAFGDQRKVMSWGPDGVRLRPSEDLSDAEAAVVSEVAETTTKDGGSLKLKTHDKVAALKLLGEHLGIFTQRVQLEVGGKVNVYLPENGRNGR
jgi:phage terminase small subunit